MQHITKIRKDRIIQTSPVMAVLWTAKLKCTYAYLFCIFGHTEPSLLGHVGPALDQFWDQMPPCMLIEHIQCIKIILLSTSFGNDRTRFPTIISKFKLLWKIWLSVCENDAISVMSLYTLTQKSAVLIMR